MTSPTPADSADLTAAIVEILDRDEYVRNWPEDERDLHRNGDWTSFTERHAAVVRLRAEKIVNLVRSARTAAPGQVVVDREALQDLLDFCDPATQADAARTRRYPPHTRAKLRAALSPDPSPKGDASS